jgi:hypothetical protein
LGEPPVRKTIVGSRGLADGAGKLLGGAVVPAEKGRVATANAWGGWGEGGREGLICPPSCSNKRRPPAPTAHAERGRSEREPARPHAHAHTRAHAAASQGGAVRVVSGEAGRGEAGRGGAGRDGAPRAWREGGAYGVWRTVRSWPG